MSKQRLLIIDDDEIICRYIEGVAREQDFEVHYACNAHAFFAGLSSFRPDIVLMDLVLPGSDGVELMNGLADQGSQVSVLLMSGMDGRTLEAAERLGIERGLSMCGGLAKPFTPQVLRESLKRVVESHRSLDEEDVRRALANDEFVPFYQPKIELATGKVLGAEVLARWNHPIHGLLAPRYFVPLAERRGLITELTSWISQRAVDQLSIWRAKGMDMHLAINISAQDLRRRDYPDRWAAMLEKADIPPSSIILEVTESETMWSTVSTTEVLTRIRLQGLQLAIDDFGTGFSSLVLLQKLPFSEVKIDKSFVMESCLSRDANVITRSIVDLGHALGLRVTAEGIENAETWDLLRELGCDMAQGYAIARPMPAEDFEKWCNEKSEMICSA
ncbi:MAG: EAL domain-containing protein (putative c-di-GMP-specific phosphodiesterase class I) [Planctomycetota bacterium]|jgi:EAL domain-containing protein (putative c-di-GMP-specific phosphodiesterase class I)/CheY-like chemotaxis protein